MQFRATGNYFYFFFQMICAPSQKCTNPKSLLKMFGWQLEAWLKHWCLGKHCQIYWMYSHATSSVRKSGSLEMNKPRVDFFLPVAGEHLVPLPVSPPAFIWWRLIIQEEWSTRTLGRGLSSILAPLCHTGKHCLFSTCAASAHLLPCRA